MFRKLRFIYNYFSEVGSPCNIKILLYCKNKIFPNEKLGRITITPSQLVERKTVQEWFQLDTSGELKLSIALSAPVVAPFIFTLITPIDFGHSYIHDFTGKKNFKIDGTWPNSFYLYDSGGLPVINIIESMGTVFNIYTKRNVTPSISVRYYRTNSFEPEFYISGIGGIEVIVRVFTSNVFKFYANCPDGYIILASVLPFHNALRFEVSPEQDILLFLASFVLIAKILETSYFPNAQNLD